MEGGFCINPNKKSALLFVALTCFLTWGLLAAALAAGLSYGDAGMTLVLACCMFLPALCSLAVRAIGREGFSHMRLRPHFRRNARMYALAWFLPAGLVIAGGALFFLLLPAAFDGQMTIVAGLLAQTPGAPTAPLVAALQTAQAILIGPIINFLPALGEELGWRGYLLPKLSACMEKRRTILLTGVIWGLWHGPMIAMGHNFGTEYWGYPALGILLMTVFCVFFGAFLAFISDRTDSAIPAAMAHGGLNAIAGLPLLFCLPIYERTLGPAAMGLIPLIPVVAAGLLFLRAYKVAPPAPEERTTDSIEEENEHA